MIQLNFIDLAILLAYFKSDEHFYHINSNELLNYSFCLEYCHTLHATLPAYTEKTWIQKFIFQIWFQKYIHSKAHQFTSDCTVFPDLNFELGLRYLKIQTLKFWNHDQNNTDGHTRFVELKGNCENIDNDTYVDDHTFIYFVRISYHFETKKWYQTNSDESLNFTLEVPIKGPDIFNKMFIESKWANFLSP